MVRVHEAYNCDVVMMCGDLTGKAIVPIVEEKPGVWWSSPWGTKEKYKSEKDLNRAKNIYEKRGFYWFLTAESELEELQSNPERVQELFQKLMLERMRYWVGLIEEKVPDNIKVVVSPGNDDAEDIDAILKGSDKIIFPLERVVDIDGTHQMISSEWVNSTPWDTPRECPEDELMEKLEREFGRLDSHDNLLCNFHAPPYGTMIDLAPKLDDKAQVRVRYGAPEMVPVGSESVRELIEKYQPLLGLHGHIHESGGLEYIGRTLCVNPGSAYTQGMLNAFVVDLPEKPGDEIVAINVTA
ncbi:MAG: metallophosphoesterase family protein [Candidatus Thorarchaeota archaeon]|jgi:Icc-related predicted phosphoesterase